MNHHRGFFFFWSYIIKIQKIFFCCFFVFPLFFGMEEEKTVDMLSIDTFNDAIDGCLLLSSGVGIDCDILRPAQIPRGDKDGKCNLLQCCVVVPASDCPHSSIPVDDSFFFLSGSVLDGLIWHRPFRCRQQETKKIEKTAEETKRR